MDSFTDNLVPEVRNERFRGGFMFCPRCGTSNVDTARFCQSCGGAVSMTPVPYSAPPPPVVPYSPQGHGGGLMRDPREAAIARAAGKRYLTPGIKSPFGAAFLSLFIIGLGQLYN